MFERCNKLQSLVHISRPDWWYHVLHSSQLLRWVTMRQRACKSHMCNTGRCLGLGLVWVFPERKMVIIASVLLLFGLGHVNCAELKEWREKTRGKYSVYRVSFRSIEGCEKNLLAASTHTTVWSKAQTGILGTSLCTGGWWETGDWWLVVIDSCDPHTVRVIVTPILWG